MEVDLAQQRHEAHLLIDVLPEDKLHAVRGLLDVLVEPLSRSLAVAPVEEEELTADTIASIRRGERDGELGKLTSHEDMLREFGA